MNVPKLRQSANLVILTILSITLILPSQISFALPGVEEDKTVEVAPPVQVTKVLLDDLEKNALVEETESQDLHIIETESTEVSSVENTVSSLDQSVLTDSIDSTLLLKETESTSSPVNKIDVGLVTSHLSPFIPTDQILVSSFRISEGLVDFIELRNSDDELVSLVDLSVVISYRLSADYNHDGVVDEQSTMRCATIKMLDYIEPNKYLSFSRLPVSGDYIYSFDHCESPMAGSPDSLVIELRRENQQNALSNPDGIVERIVVEDLDGVQRWARKGFTGSYRDGVLNSDFKPVATLDSVVWSDPLYNPPLAPELKITEILPNPTACPLDNGSLDCKPYIKVVNQSDEAIDLSSYRLRSGDIGDNATSTNTTKLSGVVAAKSYAIIHQDNQGKQISLNKSKGTVWFEDAYGVAVYKNSIKPYEKASTVAYTGLVWAYDSDNSTWKWAVASPLTADTRFDETRIVGMGNVTANTLKPCASDQYRNPVTNRCKKIESVTSELKPCAANQYRNPLTNRCNNLGSTTSSLVPCAPDEYRNPATNRCKKIVSTTSALQPCEVGYVRNPETNRCRKVAVAGSSVAKADFPVEIIKDGTKAFIGWWAVGGLLILGAGYASWEWRNEIIKAISSVSSRYASKGK